MQKTAQTAKAKAEAKFKMVGTKLNEQGLADFEANMKKRGFDTPSAYVRHLIDLDLIDDIEEERKQNEIMTQTIEVMRARIEELEGLKYNFDDKLNKQNEALNKVINIMAGMGENIKKLNEDKAKQPQEEKEPNKCLFERLIAYFRK